MIPDEPLEELANKIPQLTIILKAGKGIITETINASDMASELLLLREQKRKLVEDGEDKQSYIAYLQNILRKNGLFDDKKDDK